MFLSMKFFRRNLPPLTYDKRNELNVNNYLSMRKTVLVEHNESSLSSGLWSCCIVVVVIHPST